MHHIGTQKITVECAADWITCDVCGAESAASRKIPTARGVVSSEGDLAGWGHAIGHGATNRRDFCPSCFIALEFAVKQMINARIPPEPPTPPAVSVPLPEIVQVAA
jgi:hypothetical protein